MHPLRRRLADQTGFTMFSVTVTMMVLGTFALGAWSAANGDIPMARASQDHKRAYEAAQAGLEWYAYQLERDPTYWTNCATVPDITAGVKAPVNLQWDGPSPDTRLWRTQTDGSRYTLEILRKDSSATQCSTASPDTTALQDNTLRIRSTGQANGKTRSLIGTFKRRSFIDFIYFTSSEAQDPIVGGGTIAGCLKPRNTPRTGCTEISFSSNDSVNGPLHTNDSSVQACGSPTFGRDSRNDAFEVSGAAPGYVQAGGCSGAPVFKGNKLLNASTLTPPPQNTGLAALAGPNFTFKGQTCLKFHGAQVDVYANRQWKIDTPNRITCTGSYTTKDLTGANGPPNGVIYVAGDTAKGCTGTYTRYQIYTNTPGCGDVAIQGDYGGSVTIGAENDIIVMGDVTQTDDTNAMLGLIATNFVRVYHPIVNEQANDCGSTDNEPAGYVAPATIEAAILALNHSFMVDNYMCGDTNLGNLNVTGAIAQLFRGTVATGSGGGTATGYKKNYWYDDRLKVREPPNFLDPVKTSWRIVRETEQQPATK
jgi:Tfp pilus assembly protein PilX